MLYVPVRAAHRSCGRVRKPVLPLVACGYQHAAEQVVKSVIIGVSRRWLICIQELNGYAWDLKQGFAKVKVLETTTSITYIRHPSAIYDQG